MPPPVPALRFAFKQLLHEAPSASIPDCDSKHRADLSIHKLRTDLCFAGARTGRQHSQPQKN
jgi:hypothetical protein